MKLSTIWSTPAMALTERLNRTAEWAAQVAAARIPKRVRYWVFIQVGSKAMLPNEVVPEVRFMDLLKRAEGGPK
ncbi:hypothetical protein KKR91_01205 [Arthrobacter jiangjiafuii]|uniref:Uncharacterized protein n=1 Tax=Arthrobacter jiangjiafuii TaxID=2817475 RepID=A0A975M6F3_9MICC|nr:hypothetical protein [Arthrobacter jiangjiafuii]MBP3044875.1 hypothetical protein [Arthrobacter jiangjiafuii]QWC10301.1 hypothetical protein KKR91_01205 [Arthrobacter jiangjiafuii]